MDNNKVTLPRDVAEALESLKSEWNDWGVVMRVREATDSRAVIVYGHFCDDLTEFLSALVNGYTIEQTPEEKVREYFETCQRNWLLADEQENTESAEFLNGQLLAITQTLGLLGISIEGVNA